MYWEVIDSVIKEIRYQILTEGRTIGTKFAKIIRNKRPYIRISVPLFQRRLKCKLKKGHTICISGFSTFCRNVEFS